LVERELSDHYQVSRTPIREVLRQLVADGFLESITKKGYMN
ncbi:MAG: Bacterial regulatory protein gntR family, partial [Candidatus Atribacteria bacterium]|nr:Bacterial regulatory protein gntR family [Candidatus Atribacteria bacterium]